MKHLLVGILASGIWLILLIVCGLAYMLLTWTAGALGMPLAVALITALALGVLTAFIDWVSERMAR